jgi:hypothetical protein
MAVNNLDFAATVDDWVKATEQRMTAVFREATQRTVSLAQRRIPVDTGFARASVRASLESMPPIQKGSTGDPGKSYGYDAGNITLTIARAAIGQTIYVGWTAGYVGALENGHSKQAPSGFVGLAAQRWQITVNEVTAEAKSRAAA